MHAARGMIGRGIQRFEVVVVGLDLRTGCHRVADAKEHLGDLIGDAVDQVACAHLLYTARKRDIDRIGLHASSELCTGKLLLLRLERTFDLVARSIHGLADLRAFFRSNLSHRTQIAGQATRFSHYLDTDRLERIARSCLIDLGKCCGLQRLNFIND